VVRPRGAIARPKDKPDRAANLEAAVKSIVVAEIHVPRVRLANLYADPKQAQRRHVDAFKRFAEAKR